MEKSRIDRINELYHKSQAEGLTEEEKKELIRQICNYWTFKEALRMYLENREFEKFYQIEKEKDKVLSEIIDIIKKI